MSESLVARLSAVSPEATVSPSRTASNAGIRAEGLTFDEVYDEHFDYVSACCVITGAPMRTPPFEELRAHLRRRRASSIRAWWRRV
jgi:hypothetical protein